MRPSLTSASSLFRLDANTPSPAPPTAPSGAGAREAGASWVRQGNEEDQLLPKKIEAFAGQRVVAVSAAAKHSLAITADGAIFTWGGGEVGCLGHGEELSHLLRPKQLEARAPGQ